MPPASYRLYFDNKPAPQDRLDTFEDITVEQEVEMAWEARLNIPICTDARGVWKGEDEKFMHSFSRLRLEIKVGNRSYVPLIDGPVVGYDSQKNSEPGQSQITLIVQDDSVFLNREECLEIFEGKTDSQIADILYHREKQIIKDFQIDDAPASPNDLPMIVVRWGTAMSLLRKLAERQGMYAYVLPGSDPGKSVGCFRKFPSQDSGIPELVLLGPDRNIEDFNLTLDAQGPALVQSFALNITDHAILSSTSSFRNLDLLGDEGILNSDDQATKLNARPGMGNVVDPDQRVKNETDRSSYAFTATGSVIADCYPGVLTPYRLVQVKTVDERSIGFYRIYQVTHTLTRSSYMQSFTLKRNAQSKQTAQNTNDLIGKIVG